MNGKPVNLLLSAPDLAPLAVPAEVDRDRVLDALAWLGISRDAINRCAAVTFTPRGITFELYVGRDYQQVTVESRIR